MEMENRRKNKLDQGSNEVNLGNVLQVSMGHSGGPNFWGLDI